MVTVATLINTGAPTTVTDTITMITAATTMLLAAPTTVSAPNYGRSLPGISHSRLNNAPYF